MRFLEIAKHLSIPVKVVTDNDGDVLALEKKYENYIGSNKKDNIEICYDDTVHTGILTLGKDEKPFNYNTLEPLLLSENDLKTFNEIFNTSYLTDDDLHKYMKTHKTDCALKIFSYGSSITYPEYIKRAIQ
ncbi:hypothetical protein SDC9_208580 [bioreactor metagenome]|uniref:Uncharacterized protein n=1 Tax=bioreactor metagenome TaxID=1076179 RepID=A0A645JBY9_9ZZZZ